MQLAQRRQQTQRRRQRRELWVPVQTKHFQLHQTNGAWRHVFKRPTIPSRAVGMQPHKGCSGSFRCSSGSAQSARALLSSSTSQYWNWWAGVEAHTPEHSKATAQHEHPLGGIQGTWERRQMALGIADRPSGGSGWGSAPTARVSLALRCSSFDGRRVSMPSWRNFVKQHISCTPRATSAVRCAHEQHATSSAHGRIIRHRPHISLLVQHVLLPDESSPVLHLRARHANHPVCASRNRDLRYHALMPSAGFLDSPTPAIAAAPRTAGRSGSSCSARR